MTAGCSTIGDRAMTNAERQQRWRERRRLAKAGLAEASASKRPPQAMTNAEHQRRWREKRKLARAAERAKTGLPRLVVDGRDRILVALPPKGERIYFDEHGREIGAPPPHPGLTYIDHRGRIVEEATGTSEEEVARMYGITVEEWRQRHPER